MESLPRGKLIFVGDLQAFSALDISAPQRCFYVTFRAHERLCSVIIVSEMLFQGFLLECFRSASDVHHYRIKSGQGGARGIQLFPLRNEDSLKHG